MQKGNTANLEAAFSDAVLIMNHGLVYIEFFYMIDLCMTAKCQEVMTFDICFYMQIITSYK